MKEKIKDLKISILPILLVVTTFGIFIPGFMFFGNIDEFSISFSQVLPLMLAVSAVMFLVLLLLGFILTPIKAYFAAFMFGTGLAIYIQSNFLNRNLPEMNGAEVDWESYTAEIIISTAVWLICLLVPLVVADKKKALMTKVANIGSAFLIAVQLITLITMALTTQRSADRSFA
ncbi:MAG: hypothetical protein IJM62_05355, partial [Lachnospiraceae bacterium]|nr:hypothetical protein [Lachnospiraceae bacterium]